MDNITAFIKNNFLVIVLVALILGAINFFLSQKKRKIKSAKLVRFRNLGQLSVKIIMKCELMLLYLTDEKYFRDYENYGDVIKKGFSNDLSSIRDYEFKLELEYIKKTNEELFWDSIVKEFKNLILGFERDDDREKLIEKFKPLAEKIEENIEKVKVFYNRELAKLK